MKDFKALQNIDDEYMNRIEKSCDEEAYIIFTSGTTGEPKGVVITHAAAMNTIIDVNNKYKINENDVFLGIANLSFDYRDVSLLSTQSVRNKKPPAMRVENNGLYPNTFPDIIELFKLLS